MAEILADSQIGNSNFTIGFVLEKLRDVGKVDCSLEKLDSFEAQDITGGAAFFSVIYSVNFRWKSEVEPKRVVLKVPQLAGIEHLKKTNNDPQFIKNVEDKFAIHLERAHKLEEAVYNFYANVSTELKLPKFYYSSPYKRDSNTGIIIMEDLTQRASTVKLIPGFDNKQIENLFDELAKLHAVSLQDRTWTAKFNELPPKDLFLKEMISIINKLKEIDHERFGELVPRLIKHCTPDSFDTVFYIESNFGFPSFLVHSDLWSSNVLWATDAEGKPTSELAAIIDWQMAAQGNPGIDLCRTLAMNTSPKYRRENTDRLLQYYLDCLGKHLGTPPPLSFDQLKNAYNYALGFCASFICYGTTSYYNMESIVGDPPKEEIRKELLDRCQTIVEDMLAFYENL